MPDATGRPRVLFLCTANSCRSQIAEGWARAIHGERLEAVSAGASPSKLNPFAARAMAEAGVDIASHTSKGIEATSPETLDLVVTVCADAHESCPVFPGSARVVHRGFDDPPRLASEAKTEEEALPHYRRVRDEIRAFVETELPGLLGLD